MDEAIHVAIRAAVAVAKHRAELTRGPGRLTDLPSGPMIPWSPVRSDGPGRAPQTWTLPVLRPVRIRKPSAPAGCERRGAGHTGRAIDGPSRRPSAPERASAPHVVKNRRHVRRRTCRLHAPASPARLHRRRPSPVLPDERLRQFPRRRSRDGDRPLPCLRVRAPDELTVLSGGMAATRPVLTAILRA